ncbi:MAG TPA: anion permease, partial [Acidobacteriota bacterium]|nr:anion permease [Acidobacteriota bacterium]
LVLSLSLMVSFLTELTSNTATAALLMPVLAGTAASLDVAPELLMVPATISVSCAFMLPVATPPNAIVFGSGYVTIPQMAKAGMAMNVIGAVLTTIIIYALGIAVFQISY